MLVTVARGDRTNSNVNCGDTAGICGGLGQIHFMIGTNIFYSWDKYILRFEQMPFSILTNAVLSIKGMWEIWTNTFYDFNLQFGQVYLAIWANGFYDMDKYILRIG